jgi:hypothetical protein
MVAATPIENDISGITNIISKGNIIYGRKEKQFNRKRT